MPLDAEPPPFSTSLTEMVHFFNKAELTLTYHNHLKSIVYLRIHSWCCIFCRFVEMYNDKYPSL